MSRPLTLAEQRMWFLDQLEPGRPSANLCNGFVILGELDIDRLTDAVSRVVSSHEALRYRFIPDAQHKALCQTVAPYPFSPHLEALSGQTRDQKEKAWHDRVKQIAQKPFDLEQPPLFRLHLAELQAREHVALLVMHHIISDGDFSADAFMKDVVAALASEKFEPSRANSEDGDQALDPDHLAFWHQYLDDAPQTIDLPILKEPRCAQSAVPVHFSQEQVTQLKGLAQSHALSLSDILLASFGLLLKTHSAQNTVLIAWPDSGRTDSMRRVGYFGQPLPIRFEAQDGQTFVDLLQQTKVSIASALAHRATPFVEIVAAVAGGHNTRMPLFQTMFDFQKGLDTITAPGLEVRPHWWDPGVTEYDWSLFLFEQENGVISGRIEYQPKKYGPAMMREVAQRLVCTIEALIADPLQVAKTPLTAQDQQQVRQFGLGVTLPLPSECAHELFEQQAARTPEAIAIEFDNEKISYKQLNDSANQMAHQLRAEGVHEGMIVGLFLERSTFALTALLAIWKAGAAFLPLDPAYPSDRLKLMLDDSHSNIVLSQSSLTERLALPADCRWLLIEELLANAQSQPIEKLVVDVSHDHLNYIIYTSGSTGVPKGIAMVHRCLVNVIAWQLNDSPMREDIRALQFASLNFDISFQEIFTTWATGGTLILIDENTRRDSRALLGYLIEHRINRLFLPFVALQQLAIAADDQDQLPLTLREVLTAGEQLRSTPALRRLFTHLGDCRLLNQYGPSEAHVITSYTLANDPQQWPELPAIGFPLANTEIFLVDGSFDQVPPGAPGEVLTAGAGLAQGYLNRPEQTAASFLAHPFQQTGAQRVYRTGDLARFDSDGSLIFLRRVDQQYKVRGFRVDLGELESVLGQHPHVRETVAIVRGEAATAQIVAYVVPEQTNLQGDGLETEQIQDWQNLWEITYRESQDSSFNLAGWVSSYDEQPLPASEMRQWRDETVKRILQLKPKRVLELGCGSGLLLSELAPHCDFYAASDFSAEVVQQLASRIAKDPALSSKVELRHAQALDTDAWPAASFDTIVINSVLQLFPSVAYLDRVIANALRMLAPGGQLFVGDVQNLDLLSAYHAGVQSHRHADRSMAQIKEIFEQARAREDQLIVAPDYFYQLANRVEQIKTVSINLKSGPYRNELSKFRYDVVLKTQQASSEQASPIVLPYAGEDSLAAIEAALSQPETQTVGLKAVRNARIELDLYALACMTDQDNRNTPFDNLRATFKPTGLDPAQCWQWAQQLGVHCHVVWSDEPCNIDVWWTRDPDFICPAPQLHAPKELANDPMRLRRQRRLVDDLKDHLRRHLPEYMTPSHLMVLDSIPVKTSGKVDMSALPAPQTQSTSQQALPANPTERALVEVWQQILGMTSLSTEDDFFALGGHSLLGVELLHRIRQRLHVEITLAQLFDKRTIKAIAREIDTLTMAQHQEMDEGVL